jgi:hypothetical protein
MYIRMSDIILYVIIIGIAWLMSFGTAKEPTKRVGFIGINNLYLRINITQMATLVLALRTMSRYNVVYGMISFTIILHIINIIININKK